MPGWLLRVQRVSDATSLEGLSTEVIPDGTNRSLQYREVRGKRRYVVKTDEDKAALKDLLKINKKAKVKAYKKSKGAGARYQRKVRRRIVVKRHYPWMSDEQISALVNCAINEDDQYKKDPAQYLQKKALVLGYVACCPTCGRGAEKAPVAAGVDEE